MGGPLTVMEKPVRALAANEILLKVHAASINPCDIQLWRSGITGYVPGDKGMVRILDRFPVARNAH